METLSARVVHAGSPGSEVDELSSRRSVDRRIEDFRVALALYEEETLAALGAVEAEVRRTSQWLLQDRPLYWQEQIETKAGTGDRGQV